VTLLNFVAVGYKVTTLQISTIFQANIILLTK